jgi:hypothetical protein
VSNAKCRPAVEGSTQTRRSSHYRMTETDKLKIARSVEAIGRRTTWMDTYISHLCTHYAVDSGDIGGDVAPILRSPSTRPSFSQFKYWGLKHLRRSRR